MRKWHRNGQPASALECASQPASSKNRMLFMARSAALTPAYRLDVFGRMLAAIFGGFVLASTTAWLISGLIYAGGLQPRGIAVVSGTYLSWLIWAGGAMWAFYASSQFRVWAGILLPALTAALLAYLMI
jgi:hypothetical protein